MQDRIMALGDIALLIENYYKNAQYEADPADSYNLEGFSEAHIETDFGWYFKNLSKPTLEQLEAIKGAQ